jgi:hypothetical protein
MKTALAFYLGLGAIVIVGFFLWLLVWWIIVAPSVAIFSILLGSWVIAAIVFNEKYVGKDEDETESGSYG